MHRSVTLRAIAGPRISARRGPNSPLASHVLELAARGRARAPRVLPRRPEDFGVSNWVELLPVAFRAERPTGRIVAPVLVALFCASFLLFGGAITTLIIAPTALALRVWQLRRKARPGLLERLAGDVPVAADGVRRELREDPTHPGLRLLWAANLLEQGAFLDSLLQLAPLRDRFPDSGEVVVLAAANYAHLGQSADCLRMLRALKTTPDHSSFSAAVGLYRSCLDDLEPHVPRISIDG